MSKNRTLSISTSVSLTQSLILLLSAHPLGLTSKMSMLLSSVVPIPSPSVSQSTQVGTSMLAQSFSKETVSVMTHLVGSLTVSTSNSSSASAPVNTTSPTFVGVRILFTTKGIVVCSFIVIFTKDSKVKRSELKEKLQQASDAGELFQVTSIKVEEDGSAWGDWREATKLGLGGHDCAEMSVSSLPCYCDSCLCKYSVLLFFIALWTPLRSQLSCRFRGLFLESPGNVSCPQSHC